MAMRKLILVPQIDIGLRHYFYGASGGILGHEITFVLWDRSEHGPVWFKENYQDIFNHLDDLHSNPEYEAALELLSVDTQWDSFSPIDFSPLSTPDCAELRWWTLLYVEEYSVAHSMLFVRKDDDYYLLNGGIYHVVDERNNVEALPATWADAEARGVLESDLWFEARVPAKPFEEAYAAAIEMLHRETLKDEAKTPGSHLEIDRTIYGEFIR